MASFGFPFRIDGRGRTADADADAHLRQMIELLLFTAPGERINRPSFGTAIRQMVFSPLSNEIASATQFLIQGALQQWLGDLIQVSAVDVRAVDSTLRVSVQYVVRRTQQQQVLHLSRGM
jgi:hypothetical protein